jgi:hypothetical protein
MTNEDWTIELELDAGRQYRFRYLFDGGHWGNDWHADGHIANAQGRYDSLVVADVLSEDPSSLFFLTAHQPVQ